MVMNKKEDGALLGQGWPDEHLDDQTTCMNRILKDVLKIKRRKMAQGSVYEKWLEELLALLNPVENAKEMSDYLPVLKRSSPLKISSPNSDLKKASVMKRNDTCSEGRPA